MADARRAGNGLINKTKCCAKRKSTEGKRIQMMMTYVYDYPIGGPARFYIDGDYVIPVYGTQPAFWINGNYWYPNPPTGIPAFRVAANLVYEDRASSTPKYYFS